MNLNSSKTMFSQNPWWAGQPMGAPHGNGFAPVGPAQVPIVGLQQNHQSQGLSIAGSQPVGYNQGECPVCNKFGGSFPRR